MSDPSATVFNGRYELHRRLGRGGMAEVFLARDQLLDRPVAVKVLFPEFATDPAFVERFRREATAAANLNHPNIVGVYDWGEADNTYFIVMEYIDGRTLSEILQAEGPLHPDRVADVGADVAAALGFAHRNGVVHRDVKPGNVIVTAAGIVKVADFGIARAITATDDNLTQVGTVMGTAAYFSPEQARGDAVDPRSDLYSLGCVLYELVIGRPPFSGDSPVGIAYKHVHEAPVPPRQHDPSLPMALEAIILKCLAKNPANRYPSAEDLRADLGRYRDGNRILAEPVMPAPVDPAATGMLPATTAVGAVHDGAYGNEFDDDEEPRRSGAFLVALVLLLALLAGMLFLLARALGVGDSGTPTATLVEVPNEIGRPVADAIAELKGLGFRVETTSEANDDQEAGNVFAQDPGRGEKIADGSTVSLKVSAGLETIPVPNVIGSQVDDARRLLSGQGFTVREEPIPDESAPVGEVVDQTPGPNQDAQRGSEVVLSVSSGPEARPVPDVAGRSLAEASNLLGQNGFTVIQSSEPSSTVPKDRVIRTDPPAGTPQPKGAQITVVVSTGPAKVVVPDVTSKKEADAVAALQAKGFTVTKSDATTADPSMDGRVKSQDPVGGTEAEPGSNVNIVVWRYTGPPAP